MLVHIIHALIRARTRYTCASAHPHKNAHVQHMTQSSAHAQTRMHPGTCGLTTHAHASALEHACMHAHAHALRTHAGTFMRAPAQCTCMHTHAHARTHLHMRTHLCNHLQFGCALTDWDHTPHLWCVIRKTLSFFDCLALFVLHSHGLASGGNAGGCGRVASPAGVCGNGDAA